MHTDDLRHCVLGDSGTLNRTASSMGRLRIAQQLVATVGCLATLMLLWKVPTAAATANNVGPMRLVVNSTSDALRLSRAASQVGMTVDAVVVGSVKVDVPIQIGNFSRLSITGHGEGAQLKFSGRPTSSIGVDFDNPNSNVTKANGKLKSEFFDVRSNASLVVERFSIIEQQHQGGGDDDTIGTSSPAVLIKLHPGSLVEANGCTLHADTLISDAERGSTDVSTFVKMTHATGSRESLSNCGVSWVRGQAQPLEEQTKSADGRRVNVSVEERLMTAWGGDEDYQRRLNGNKCPQGYDGASCNDCASGFSMDSDGKCERTEVQCTVWTEFGGGVLAVLGIVVLILILDSVRNGKSPPHRVAQISGIAIDCCCRSSGERYCQDTNCTSGQPSEKANKDTSWWGRERLGRFFHGCMAFVVTSQIVSQGAQVLELKLPSAMKDVVVGLEWTNMDPLLVPVACSFTRASFLDRAVGTVGLLTAFLTVLALSQIAIGTGRNAPSGNKGLADTRSSTISRFLRWDAVRVGGDVCSSSSRQPGEASSARVRGLEVWRDRGAWEQWDKWDPFERHAIAAVMACLLMHPVVCTMLLRVFDCRNIEEDGGLWLRSDLSIECLSVQHQRYRVVAGIFLGLYGIGIPVAFAALAMWAKRIDDAGTDADTSLVGNAVRALKESISTSDTNNLPSREMTAADAMTSEEARGRGGCASGAGNTKIANRDRILQSSSHTFRQCANDDAGMDECGQNVAGCNCTGVKHTVSQQTLDGALASNCPSRMDREKGGGEHRSGRQIPRGETRWSDVCCHAGSRDAERTSPMGMENTSFLGRAWMISGRCVLSVASLAGRSAPSALGDYHPGNRWRCTIPLWSPYCTHPHWFAAWDLARRNLLTGMLTLIPANEGAIIERAAVACAMAGLSLVVAEVARPYRDPWIGWIYRIGGIVILLVDIMGLLQEVWAEDRRSPSVVTIEALFLLFLPLMLLCICCGWRLSLAEQHAIDTTAIIPWPESASFRGPTDAGAGPIDGDSGNNSLPSDTCVSWYKEEPTLSIESPNPNPKERRSGKRSISSCGSDYSPNSPRRSWSRPWPKTEPKPAKVQDTAADASTLQAIRDGNVNEESTKWDDNSCRSITQSNVFGRSMLSRSPRAMAILRFGIGFRSASGFNSSELRVPIETHQTPSGRVFHSNTIEIGARKLPRSDLSNYGVRGSSTPPLIRCHSRSDSSDLNSNTVGADNSRVQKRTAVPIIAPGAPSIDGHKSRFSSRMRPSSSSFESTSFESSTPEDRSRKGLEGVASRKRGAWRMSRSSSGFFNQSRSSSGFFNQSRSSSGSQSGDMNRSPCMVSSPGSGGSKASHKGSRTNTHFSRGGSSFFNIVSTSSGSFMSSGSISSLTNSASGPPVLRALQTASPPIVENELWMTNSPDGSKRGWSLPKRGWPLDLPAVSEMPSHLTKKEDEIARGPSTDELSATAERETSSPKVANSEGRSNIIKYRAILWRGGSGPSSCESRVSEGKRNAVCTDVGESRVDDPSRLTTGGRMKTSCSSPELEHDDVDIEGGVELDENPASLMRDGVHIGNVNTDNGAME